MLRIKIKKEDYSFEEGSRTLSITYLQPIGSFAADSCPARKSRGVIRDGYLYPASYGKAGIYKINLSNYTDITLIDLGFTSVYKPLAGSGTSENYMVLVNEDLIIGYDFQITASDGIIATAGSERILPIATPLFQYKNFLFGWTSSYGSEYFVCYLLTPYLPSINNLSSAVVKTTDMTMKITYELTEKTS